MTHADPLADALAQLRRDYLTEAPARVVELHKDYDAVLAGEPGAARSLKGRFHRLAGSGGSYGFPEVSDVARRAELWLAAHEDDPAQAAVVLGPLLDELEGAFRRAATGLLAPEPDLPKHTDFGWHALLVGAEPVRGRALASRLESAGFDVTIASADTPEATPPIPPELVVLVHEPGGPDPYPLAAAWTGRRGVRPRGVVLVEAGTGYDRLRAAASGIDAIFSAEQAEGELQGFAKAIARVGSPPAKVLLVEDDPVQAQAIAGILSQANLRVTRCTTVAEASTLLGVEYPDLILLDIHLPDGEGFTVARLARQDQRLALVPIVFLTATTDTGAQIRAVRAGGDDYLRKPVDPTLLTLLVLNRIERGRRVREMAHRDGLTGLLNHATLMAELEHAVEASRRRGEKFAYVMADLDHFKRINDTWGHLVGDTVLVHVARLLQRLGRASDLLGRYGGDEFAMILLNNDAEGAAVLATRIRDAMAAEPAAAPTGEPIPASLSVGIAVFPDDGATAAALVESADRALYQSKRLGRDRVMRAGDPT
ncbi:MAG TPA: diguanylate cyclase [Gemmatimonadales bacterium]|nr:diguanylate cyclase [Gemmatimonadales bacterium]